MNILSLLPLPALFFLGAIILAAVIGILIFKKKKGEKTNKIPQPQSIPQQGTPLSQTPTSSLQPDFISPPTTDQVNAKNVSLKIAKNGDSRFVALIIVAAAFAILLPITAVLIVKNQTVTNQQSDSQQQTVETGNPTCNAITITDTLGNPLTDSELTKLQPRDEVKILISTSAENSIDKARFRVNGSAWQEVNIKDKDGRSFVANYILEDNTKKFTIEAEIHDQNKGWL